MADDAPLTPEQVQPGVLPGILGRARVVVTPYPFGVSDADHLRVIVANSQPGVVVNIHGRVARPGTDAVPFDFQFTPASDRLPTSKDFALGAGFVTNLSVFASGATPQIGQTFVIVQLVRSLGATAFIMGTLLQGYITTTQNLGWPGSPIMSSTDGEPYLRTITGTVPAPQTDFSEEVPTGARWELISVRAYLTTSGNVANRIPNIKLFSPTVFTYFSASPFVQTAAQVGSYTWAPNLPYQSCALKFSFNVTTPLPLNTILHAGSIFASDNDGNQPLDQWTAPEYFVREWLEVG